MAKLGKHKVIVHNDMDYNQKLEFEFEVNVSKNGQFYFSLNEQQKEQLMNLASFILLRNKFVHKPLDLSSWHATSEPVAELQQKTQSTGLWAKSLA